MARRDRKHKPKPPVRVGINPATSDLIYDDEEREFLMAMQRYKALYRRPFPSWSEALEVLRALGYRRVAKPVPLESLPRTRNEPRS